jgi:hypothetical protein
MSANGTKQTFATSSKTWANDPIRTSPKCGMLGAMQFRLSELGPPFSGFFHQSVDAYRCPESLNYRGWQVPGDDKG